MHPAAWNALDYKECTTIILYEIFSAAFMGEHPLQNPSTHSLQGVTADMYSEDYRQTSELSVRAGGQEP